MGLLDGLLGQVLGGQMPPDAQNDPRMRGMPGGMGGLESMLGGAGGRGAGGGALMALLPVLLQALQRNGGLGGLLSQFQQKGYGEQADSWVSTGRNQPIGGDILSQVLGSGQMDEIAQQLGMSRHEAADQMASALPDVVDRMTPQGNVPSNSDDLVNRALEILQRGGR
jgi:uncharacterized protein YidB (DUF937 family)